MKKILFLISIALCMTFVSCGNQEAQNEEKQITSTSESDETTNNEDLMDEVTLEEAEEIEADLESESEELDTDIESLESEADDLDNSLNELDNL